MLTSVVSMAKSRQFLFPFHKMTLSRGRGSIPSTLIGGHPREDGKKDKKKGRRADGLNGGGAWRVVEKTRNLSGMLCECGIRNANGQ